MQLGLTGAEAEQTPAVWNNRGVSRTPFGRRSSWSLRWAMMRRTTSRSSGQRPK